MQVHFCKASVNLQNNNKYCTERKRDETSYYFFLIGTNRVLQTTTNLLSQWHLKSFYFCVYQHPQRVTEPFIAP